MEKKEIGFIVSVVFIILVLLSFSIISIVPIVPKDLFSDSGGPCGDFTKLSDNTCIPNDEGIIKYLVDNKYLSVSKTNARVAIGLDTKILPLEPWQTKWQDYGANCNRVPDPGWDPKLTGPDRTVVINYLLSDKPTVCKNNTCYVNGLCVTPYKSGSDCCPGCASIAVEDGGCAGRILCDPSLVCGEATKVEYPGTVLRCGTLPEIAPKCLDGVVSGDCWATGHIDEQRRVPYVRWNSTCSENSLCAMNDGMNEFECAIGCAGRTQRECSKQCFPKLWKWYQVLKEGVPVGFWQSDELWNVGDPSPKYCRDPGCAYSRDLGANPEANSCSDCKNCNNLSEFNGKIGNYYCDNCEKCLLNIKPADTGDCGDYGKEISCTNLNRCTGCQKNMYNLFGSISQNTCGQCALASNNCVFYTKNPFEIVGNSIKQRQSSSDYNTNIF